MFYEWTLFVSLASGQIFYTKIGDVTEYRGCAKKSELDTIEFPIEVVGLIAPASRTDKIKAFLGMDHKRCISVRGMDSEDQNAKD